jgi:hypothetical protein
MSNRPPPSPLPYFQNLILVLVHVPHPTDLRSLPRFLIPLPTTSFPNWSEELLWVENRIENPSAHRTGDQAGDRAGDRDGDRGGDRGGDRVADRSLEDS